MTGFESIVLKLGTSVAKLAFKCWARSGSGSNTLAEFDHLLGRTFEGDIRTQRRTRRFFERIAEAIADEQTQFFEHGGKAIPDNEKTAAILAVADTFDALEIDSQSLLDNDLDPLRLEDMLRNASPLATRDLNESATALYQRILRDACNYLVEIISTLPNFQTKATRELLRRESDILELVQKILEQIPQWRGSKNKLDRNGAFETQYRRQVARKLDMLQLIGIDLHRIRPRYKLSVAYVSLGAEGAGAGDGDESGGTRVEDVLERSTRILIKGEPGSGKTTILQWLAVNAARGTFEASLDDWNQLVPFYIRLRTYAQTQFPEPEDFVKSVGQNVSDHMPKRWVGETLKSGRGLVLIDGVDELPPIRRNEAEEWIGDLVENFPKCRYVVTSRPPAVTDYWLEEQDFAHTLLQPMGLQDIDRFIDYWHRSNRDAVYDAENDDIDRYRRRLQALIKESAPIRNLASTPLLCSMLCALNLDRRSQIPRDRMDLYRLVLEALLERRDSERGIVTTPDVSLSRVQKELLLQDFAHWLILNGHIDSDRNTFTERLAAKLQNLPQVTASASAVATYMLERSGVLREAVVGRIDFLHRTFQEYLAAAAFVASDNIGLLVSKANDDQWRQVIILAAGHANVKQRRKLILGMLRTVEQSGPNLQRQIGFLAISCRETAVELPAEVKERLEQEMQRLFPPRHDEDARYFAAAGTEAIPFLRGHTNADASTVSLCVRTLALIGDDAVLPALEEYGADDRPEVVGRLVWAWDFFDQGEFARRVLSRSPWKGPLTMKSRTTLSGVEELSQLEEFTCLDSPELSDIQPVSFLRNLRKLTISDCRALASLPDLSALRRLISVSVEDCAAMTDVSGLYDANTIESLALIRLSELRNIEALHSLKALKYLSLENCGCIDTLAPLSSLTQLESLNIKGCPLVSSLIPVVDLPRLKSIEVESLSLTDNLPDEVVRRIDIQ
jgi:hypothetical protein